VFLGEYTHALDREFRLALPAPLRVAAGDALARGLCVMPGPGPCIVAFTKDRLEHLLALLDGDPSVGRGAARDFKRSLGSQAVVVAPDRQGRIRLPEALRCHAGIAKEVVVVGVVDSIEFWSAATYKAREASRRTAFERLASRVLG
jgi:MraZ protein